MAKDKIALSFEQAEYYTLQEACDYLNMKHGTSNITEKKLLKQISFYKINTYIHFRMDNAKEFDNVGLYFENYDTNIIETVCKDISVHGQKDSYYIENNLIVDEKINKHLLTVFQKLSDYISIKILDDIYMGHLLFLVDDWTIENMALSTNMDGRTRLFCFDGFLTKGNLNENPRAPSVLQEWSIEIDKNRCFAKDIGNISFKLKSSETNFLQDFKSKLPFDNVYFDVRSNDLVFVDFDIRIYDLIVLHKDLMELENNIISNNPAPSRQISEIKPRKGVSIHKIQAKERAKIISRALWNNDRENKIRISEMANLVYRELYDSEYREQLPDNQETLTGWIQDVAPDYARTGGRPKNEP